MSKIRATAVLFAMVGCMFATEAQAAYEMQLRFRSMVRRTQLLQSTNQYVITVVANLRTAEVATSVSPTIDMIEVNWVYNPLRYQPILNPPMTFDEAGDALVLVVVMYERSGNPDEVRQILRNILRPATSDRIRELAPIPNQTSREKIITDVMSYLEPIIRYHSGQDELFGISELPTGDAPAPGPERSLLCYTTEPTFRAAYNVTTRITDDSTAPQSPGDAPLTFGGGSPGSGSDDGQPGSGGDGSDGVAPQPATRNPQIGGVWHSNIGRTYIFRDTSTGFSWETTDFSGRPQVSRGRFLSNNRFEVSWYDDRGRYQGHSEGTVRSVGAQAVRLLADNGVQFFREPMAP